MKNKKIFIMVLFCLIIVQYSFAAEKVYYENCEDTIYSEHFLEKKFGTSYLSYWNELKSEISQSSIAHSGNYSATYNPFQTGNPHARLGVGNIAYGNTSNFSLSSVNSRYWYIRWYQRWEDGNNSGANKNLYINSQPVGDYVIVLEKTGPQYFHFFIKDHDTYGLVVNSWPTHSGGSLDDLEWHKMELFIDSGTTGGSNGDYWFKIDDITLTSGSGKNFNRTIHSNPIENIGWPSNTSNASGSQQIWVDDMEIYTVSGPSDIPGEEGSFSGVGNSLEIVKD